LWASFADTIRQVLRDAGVVGASRQKLTVKLDNAVIFLPLVAAYAPTHSLRFAFADLSLTREFKSSPLLQHLAAAVRNAALSRAAHPPPIPPPPSSSDAFAVDTLLTSSRLRLAIARFAGAPAPLDAPADDVGHADGLTVRVKSNLVAGAAPLIAASVAWVDLAPAASTFARFLDLIWGENGLAGFIEVRPDPPPPPFF
jgi:hypothetical protein